MSSASRLRRVALWCLTVSILAGGAFAAYLLTRTPMVAVAVQDRPVEVPEGTTLGQLILREHLEAENGRLLDVEGSVLQRRFDPGSITLNGVERPRASLLATGDRVAVQDGDDRTERVERVVQQTDPQPPNPAHLLGTVPGVQVTFRGELSGIVVRSFFRPTGKLDPPKAVALTFDDGPWPRTTAKILSILRRHKVAATFFTVGYLAERYPMLVHREVAMGMSVGNHSWDHPIDPAFADLDASKRWSEMARVSQELVDRGVGGVTLFRPPGGSWSDEVRDQAAELGMRLVLWDVDTRDWQKDRRPKAIVHSVLSKVRPGSIVLMHDGGGDAEHTIAALPDVIEGLRKAGYRLVAL